MQRSHSSPPPPSHWPPPMPSSETKTVSARVAARILVVEEEGAGAGELGITLEALGHAVVGVATSAHEALVLGQTLHPDLALMGVHLHGDLDGIATAALLRRHLSLPVVYVTSRSDDSSIQRASDTEPYGYVLKPYGPIELRIAIEVALRRMESERKRRDSDLAYRRIVDWTNEGVWSTNERAETTLANGQIGMLLGRSSADLLGKSFFDFVHEGERMLARHAFVDCRRGQDCRFEARLLRAEGEPLWASISLSSASSGSPESTSLIAIVHDISERKASEEALRAALAHLKQENGALAHLVKLDDLTGLYNRRELERFLACELERAATKPELCVILADIDHFKEVNDGFGHHAGDEVLRQLAKLFQDALCSGELICRYGGEEFAFVLPKADEAQALASAERLRGLVESRTFWASDLSGQRVPLNVTLSLGLASANPSGETCEELVGRADQALYAAKARGRNCVVSAARLAREPSVKPSRAGAR
jgi:diguanylate cyclase (GGDEF)-like protein/PAS domain S-box-containing protein